MKRYKFIPLLILICLICAVMLVCASCKANEYIVTFIVDEKTYATVTTAGNETITMPANPTKDGYTFDGWYVDEGTWQSSFTATSLSFSALTSDLIVYAKFADSTITYEWQITKDATCTDAGLEERINPETNQQESREIIPLGHVYGEFITIREPTCTVDGSRGKTCSRCRNVVQESIPMIDHTPDEWKIIEQPTCSSSGKKVKECKICKTELAAEVLDAISNHPFNEYAECTICGISNLDVSVQSDGTAIILGFKSADDVCPTLVIPKYYNGSTVTEIGLGAFAQCDSLINVTIPESVTTIGFWAFNSCSGLTSVTIPYSVTRITAGAFGWCSSLTTIIIDKANPVYHSASNCLIETLTKTLVLSWQNSVIPNDGSVTSIGPYAFGGRSELTSITIPDAITKIDEDAFSECSNLQYNRYDNALYLGNANNPYLALVKVVNYYVGSCTIHESAKIISGKAFDSCNNLTSITIPDRESISDLHPTNSY